MQKKLHIQIANIAKKLRSVNTLLRTIAITIR